MIQDIHRSCIIKSTVALVLAGGFAGEFSTGYTSLPKALLPVFGRPISDYVLQALEQSDVEKIFIVQDEGANLQKSLTPGSKCQFITRNKDNSSLGMGVFFALEKIAEFYGNVELSKRMIVVVPCDTPLVTKDNFNQLIGKVAGKNADVTITIIAASLLEKRYPQKNYRSIYLADYKAGYTMQNVIFVNGEFIRLKPPEEPGKLRFSFRGWDEKVLKRVEDGINSIENLRHQSLFHDKLFMLWLLTKGYSSYILRFMLRLAFRSLTMSKVIEYLDGADHMQAAYIESEEVEFSADIDRPEDFQMLLGTPWKTSE